MLRERRRVLNQSVKPNRRLDRKSSRGMVFENEELRLRTINISADVERGQSDIRKLRRENELLRREIWTLRDEYDRLDKLLQDHHQKQLTQENSEENHTHHHHHHHHHDNQIDYSDNSTCDDETESSSDSCSKCTIIENYISTSLDAETDKFENCEHKSDDSSGKIEGEIRTLSTVSEETGGHSEMTDFDPSPIISENIQWTDNLLNADCSMTLTSFKMGGNLEDLLTDIANLSRDIKQLQLRGNHLAPTGSNEYLSNKPDILTTSVSMGSLAEKDDESSKKPFRSEVNLILSPLNVNDNADNVSNDSPIIIPPLLQPLIGFEKFVEEKIPALLEEPPELPEPQQSATKTNTDIVRIQYIKTPSISLNEKATKQQHSKDKRLSLDLDPVQTTENSTTVIETNGKNKTPQTIPTTPTTPTTPKTKKKRNLGIFFKRNKKDKSKKQNDDDDDFYFQSPTNQINSSGGLRTTAKQQKQLFKMKTKNPKLRKQQMQQQQYRRNIIENRKSGNSNNSKKYARLSIDENFIDEDGGGDGGGGSGADSKSDKNSGDAGSGKHSSNDSTSSSFRSRKLSITSFPKSDKIPWCACWGNGCF